MFSIFKSSKLEKCDNGKKRKLSRRRPNRRITKRGRRRIGISQADDLSRVRKIGEGEDVALKCINEVRRDLGDSITREASQERVVNEKGPKLNYPVCKNATIKAEAVLAQKA